MLFWGQKSTLLKVPAHRAAGTERWYDYSRPWAGPDIAGCRVSGFTFGLIAAAGCVLLCKHKGTHQSGVIAKLHLSKLQVGQVLGREKVFFER